jgi:sugar phosphate isomerase/epimerase
MANSRPISLAALTVLEVSPLEAVRIAANCGYTHVGLRPVAATATEPHFPILESQSLSDELAHVLAGEGIGVLDVEIVRLVPQMDWEELERVLEFAARFAANRLLVADNDPEPMRSRDSLARLGERASAFSVVPHLEFMPWTCAPDLTAAKARVAGIANARLLVDAFHLARSGGSPKDLAPGDPDVGYLQLCDIAGPVPPIDEILREARSERLMPGTGEIDLCALLGRFPGLSLSLEVPNDAMRDDGISAEERARLAIGHMRAVLDRCHASG